MPAVGDDAAGEPIIRQLRPKDVVVSWYHAGAAIAEMGPKGRTAIDGLVDQRCRSCGVSNGGRYAAGRESRQDIEGSGSFRGKCDESHKSPGGLLPVLQFHPLRCPHLTCRMRTSGSVFR